MFTSLMRVLNETLPCSRNFFKMKQTSRNEQDEDEERKGGVEDDRESRSSRWKRNVVKIATPRIVRGLSLGKSPSRRTSMSSLSSVCSSRNNSIIQSNNDSDSSDNSIRVRTEDQARPPEVRVRKNLSRNSVRNSSLRNSASLS